jgi:hypothetical protein
MGLVLCLQLVLTCIYACYGREYGMFITNKTPQASLTDMHQNWAGPILLAVIIIAISQWFMGGSKNFVLPENGIDPE